MRCPLTISNMRNTPSRSRKQYKKTVSAPISMAYVPSHTRCELTIRQATADDIPDLRDLIQASVRGLPGGGLFARPIRRRVGHGLWRRYSTNCRWNLLHRGISRRPSRVRRAGASTRPFSAAIIAPGREDDLLDPLQDAAKIRAFFVHPAWARRGIGTMILSACEDAAIAAGFTRFEMGATLTGVKLYEVRGYTRGLRAS